MKKELTAAEQYRAFIASRDEVLIDVLLPSGRVFKFAELPSVFKAAFEIGTLPSGGTNDAIQKWIDAGVIEPNDITPDQQAIASEGLRIMNLVIDHSRSPKLVVGPAKNADELSMSELANEDIDYLVSWARAGGNVSLMLNTFPQRPSASPVAKSNRQARRAAAKRTA